MALTGVVKFPNHAPYRAQEPTVDYMEDGVLHMDVPMRQVVVESESDLSDLPLDRYFPGSIAYTADGTGKWCLDADGVWQSLVPAETVEEET